MKQTPLPPGVKFQRVFQHKGATTFLQQHIQAAQMILEGVEGFLVGLNTSAVALNISADLLLFDEGERDLPNNLQLKFEAYG